MVYIEYGTYLCYVSKNDLIVSYQKVWIKKTEHAEVL